MNMKTDRNIRQLAVAWLNSSRNFHQGLQILLNSGFKPGVVAKLHRVGPHAPEAAERLVFLIREYISVFGKPDQPEDTDAVLHVFDGMPSPEDTPDEESKAILYRAKRGKNPPRIGKIISEYASLYRKREKAFRLLTEMPEDNDEKNIKKRKELSDSMERATDRMEKLYPLFQKHIETNQDITEEEADAVAIETKPVEETAKQEEDFESLSVEQLQQLVIKKSQARSKAKNWLKYQSPQPKPEPNPLPDCAARIKYEKKLARLENEIEKIRYIIAQKMP